MNFMNNIKKFVLTVFCCLFIFTLLCACSTNSNARIVGSWDAGGSTPSGFPDDMILREDGTGVVEGWIGTNWSVKDGKLTLTLGMTDAYYVYDYTCSGSSLTLKMNGDSVSYEKK